MKVHFITFVTLIFIISCTSQESNTSQIPSWFASVDKSDENIIYGSGTSNIKENAIQNALKEAIGKIKVVVSGVTQSQSQLLNDTTSDQVQVITSSKVESFSLSGYEVSNIFFDQKNKLFYAQVKINKLKIFNEKSTYYNSEKEKLKQDVETLKNNKISLNIKFNILQNQPKTFAKLQSDLIILNSLNSSFPLKQELSEISKLEKQVNNFKYKIKFTYKEAGKLPILNKLAKNSINKLRLSFVSDANKEDALTVQISFSNYISKQDVIYGKFVVQSSVFVTLESQNKVITNKNITFSSSSGVSYEDAKSKSMERFSSQFETLIVNLVGI